MTVDGGLFMLSAVLGGAAIFFALKAVYYAGKSSAAHEAVAIMADDPVVRLHAERVAREAPRSAIRISLLIVPLVAWLCVLARWVA